jgi:hypothetical protein
MGDPLPGVEFEVDDSLDYVNVEEYPCIDLDSSVVSPLCHSGEELPPKNIKILLLRIV